MSPALRWKVLLAVLLLAASWSERVLAAGSKARCIAAYEDGQRLEFEQSFKLAAEKFAFCASAECPTAMHHECAALLDSVRAQTPALVFLILDEAGAPVRGARIAIDEAGPQPFDGEPVRLDPGEYQFAFEADGYSQVVRKISVSSAGTTQVEVRLPLACGAAAAEPAAQQPAPSAPKSRTFAQCSDPLEKQPSPSPVRSTTAKPKTALRTALLLGTSALGVLGGAGFAYFGLSARRGDHNLTACAPGCSPEAVADVRRDYALANGALALGLAGIVGSAVVWFTGNPKQAEPPRANARRWDVQLGTVSTLTTRF